MIREVRLRPLGLDDEAEFVAAHRTMALEEFAFGIGYQEALDWRAYVDRLGALRRATGDIDGFVPSTFLVATVAGRIIGRSSIRHVLNAYLASEGGHIGYCVLPDSRGHGHATSILQQSVVIARAAGVERVLVTCDGTNVASSTVIERCGGAFESAVPSADGGPPKLRYWIA